MRAVLLTLSLLAASLAAPSASAEEATLPSFLARIRVEAPGTSADTVAFGVASSATDGYDRGQDAPEPPPPPAGAWVSAYVASPQGRLSRSLVAPAGEGEWRVRVDTDGPAGEVRLRWSASDFGALPLSYAVEGTVHGATVDLRETELLTFAKPEGLHSVLLDVRAYALDGRVASAPEDLRARPGAWPNEVALSWRPPADDGGHAVREYQVFRVEGEAPTLLATTTELGILLASQEEGAAIYAVRAWTRLGAGDPARVETWVVGLPRALQPPPDAEVAREERLDQPATRVDAPGRTVDVARVDASRDLHDPRYTTFAVDAPLVGPQHVVVFTFVPAPAEAHVGALDVPGASAEAPGARVGAAVVTWREDARGGVGLHVDLGAGDDSRRLSVGAPLLP